MLKKDETPSPLTMMACHPLSSGLVFGIDVGISSCGWAVVDKKGKAIRGIGSHCFEAAESEKGKLLNRIRREKRLSRRVVRRRKERIASLRKFLEERGVYEDCSPEHLQQALLGKNAGGFDVWQARVKGLTERLPAEETAAVLLHLAQHRGYLSNSKRERGNNAVDDKKKMLKAIDEIEVEAATGNYRSYAEQVLKAERLQGRRRNRQGDYTYTPTRKRLEEEAKKILTAQHEAGATWATSSFIEDYRRLAFEQRPLTSSWQMVGWCQFEENRKRSSRFAPTFEKFRLASHLAREELEGEGVSPRALSSEEIEKVLALLGTMKGISYKRIRRTLGIEDSLRFKELNLKSKDKSKKDHEEKDRAGKEVSTQDELEKSDITNTKEGAGVGTFLLREALTRGLGEGAWHEIAAKPFALDAVADILTFESGLEAIERRVCAWQRKFTLPEGAAEAILKACEDGKFDKFKGTAHLSAKAAGKILVFLRQGKMYHEACEGARYDATRMRLEDITKIPNAVVRRALVRARKQVAILVREYGKPEAIHVELLRDVGRSEKARKLMQAGIKKNREENEERKKEFLESVGRKPDDFCSYGELQSYEYWLQQERCCLYCGKDLAVRDLLGGANKTELDHILPRSCCADNSKASKVLACTACNRNKSGETPWGWRGENNVAWWRAFERRVKAMTCQKEKRRRLLSQKKACEIDEGFANRHKTDSSYIARRLLHELQTLYPESYHSDGRFREEKKRRLFARPGLLTEQLRRAWLGEVWRKDREDDRHHAMDALIVAVTSEGTLQRMTKFFQHWEGQGRPTYRLKKFAPPWESFAEDAKRALEGWFVSRSEVHRVHGEGHEAKVYRKRPRDGCLMVRVPVRDIAKKPKKLDYLPDREAGNAALYRALKVWLEQEDKEALPRIVSYKNGVKQVGDAIRKVRLEVIKKSSRPLDKRYDGDNKGHVLSGSLVQVDVYRGRGTRSKFELVPVYNHQILTKNIPTPRKAIVSGKAESEWKTVEAEDFLFSLYRWSFVVVRKKGGEVIEGYYRGIDRRSGGIEISPHNKRGEKKSVGIKTCESVKKITIDRLGRKETKQDKFSRNESARLSEAGSQKKPSSSD